MKRGSHWLFTVAIAAVSLLSACDDPPAAVTPLLGKTTPVAVEQTAPTKLDYGDIYIEGSIGDASNLIPYLSGDSASSEVTGLIFSSLVKFDKNYNPSGDMASHWEISEDQRTITFFLKEDIAWHDGAPFTAEDLMFQYAMMIHPDVPSAYKETFFLIEKAEAVDPYTFKVTFREPYAPGLIRIGGMTGLPRHLLKDTPPIDLIKAEIARNPVGNGPFVFGEWKSQTHVVVNANKNHFDGAPSIERVMIKVIPDTATQFLELKAGALDSMGLEPVQYLNMSDSSFFKKEYVKYKYLSNSYTYLGYNLTNPLFTDIRVRQALSYAINKVEVVDGALRGLGIPATGSIKPETYAYNPNVKRYPHDPAKAKALLAEAGWKDSDGDGVIDKQGVPFTFTVVTNQGNAQRAKSAEIIQQQLKAVGVALEIQVIEWSAFINNYINKRKFDAVLLGWALSPDPDQYEMWHSSKTGEHEFNFISYNNPEVDQILDQARKTFDADQRKKLYGRFQEILGEEQPYTFLYVPESLPIVHKRFRGIDPGAAGISYNFADWWVAKQDHKYKIIP
jgi:peptide/nickel transport system substrate-binding protein